MVSTRMSGYSRRSWDSAMASVAARALREVPFYRDHCADRESVPDLPDPVPVTELDGRLWALCPISSPYNPSREPTLWTGSPGDLAAALRVAGLSLPVVEVRSSLVPWTRLGVGKPRYAAVLAPGATGNAADFDGPARELIARSREVALVSPADALADVVSRLDARGPALTRVELSTAGAVDSHALLHDKRVGYFAAMAPCGRFHVVWRRFHVADADGGLAVTTLRRRRPTLVRVVIPGNASVAECPRHGVPAIHF